LRAGAEEFVGEGCQQAGPVAAGTVGVNTSAVGQALKRCERYVDNFVARRTGQARYETRATGIVVGVAPVWVPIVRGWHAPLVHTILLS